MHSANVVLKSYIRETGMSQNELANRVGVSPGTLSALAQGKAPLHQLRMAQRIAKELGTTVDELWPLEDSL